MAKTNTGITVEEDVLSRTDAIIEALQEQDEFGRKMDRSALIERLLAEWNEEHAHILEGDGTGNLTAMAAPTAD